MESMQIGKDCSKKEVFNIFYKPPLPAIAAQKWKDFGYELDIPPEDLKAMQLQMNLGAKDVKTVMIEMFDDWVESQGEDATMGKLIEILESLRWKNSADALKVEFGKTIPPSTSATAVAATPPTMNQPVMVPVPQTAAASVVVTTVSRPVTEPDQQDIGSKAVSKVSEELTDIKIDDPEILDFIQSMKPLDVEVVSPSEQMTFKDKYNLPAGGKGLALIMNIVEFDDELPRKGSDKDLEYMSELWPQLGYELYPKSKKDRELKKRSKEEVIRLIDSFVEKCQASKPKSIVVFVGSHGGLNTIHTSDGKSIHLYGDLVNKFGRESCPVIRACPKIFLIQTCQNIKRNETDSYNSAAPISDALIVTAQVPGHEANRDAFKGSWFIYCLTYVIMNHAHKTSFQDMLKLTRRMVLQIESNANKEGKVLMGQIPVITDIDMDTLYLTLDP